MINTAHTNQPDGAEVHAERTGERQMRRRVREVEREPRESRRDHDDARCLAALAQAEVPALLDAEVVVDEADDAEPDDEGEHGPARGRELHTSASDVREQEPDHRRDNDREAAHCRRTRLGHVWMRDGPVVADLLAEAEAPQPRDQQRRPEDGHEEGGAGRHEHRDHSVAGSSVFAPSGLVSPLGTSGVAASNRPCATTSMPSARLALTSTASPGRTRSSTRSRA